jgi:hypothetical protein
LTTFCVKSLVYEKQKVYMNPEQTTIRRTSCKRFCGQSLSFQIVLKLWRHVFEESPD